MNRKLKKDNYFFSKKVIEESQKEEIYLRYQRCKFEVAELAKLDNETLAPLIKTGQDSIQPY